MYSKIRSVETEFEEDRDYSERFRVEHIMGELPRGIRNDC